MSYTLSDKEMLVSGDEKSFRILYDRYWQGLFKKAKARLGNTDDAEDILQDIFVTLWKNRLSIEVNESLQPYLFTALKYAIIKKVQRDHARNKIYPLNPDNIEGLTISNEDLLQYKELEKLIDHEVNHLPPRMKEIYRLSRQEQLSIREIALQLQLSEQTVKNILTESVKRLRTKLSKLQVVIFLL
ncbi:RNA polymerase sigma factor [Terrimonas rubra]|uniref:RNA polymerase sigma factor n=1 Tax=Terrimonas rubra TaxID=1035890 RepID=A0ABW6A5I6_9BACT